MLEMFYSDPESVYQNRCLRKAFSLVAPSCSERASTGSNRRMQGIRCVIGRLYGPDLVVYPPPLCDGIVVQAGEHNFVNTCPLK